MKSNRARQISHIHPALTQNNNTGIKVIHQNIQGMTAHRKDVEGHTTLTAAYIICMPGTHLQQRSPWPFKAVVAITFMLNEVRGQ